MTIAGGTIVSSLLSDRLTRKFGAGMVTAVSVLLTFFGYCAMESTAGLWATSYFVLNKGIDPETAARYASLFYFGITFGRFLCGFFADKLGD